MNPATLDSEFAQDAIAFRLLAKLAQARPLLAKRGLLALFDTDTLPASTDGAVAFHGDAVQIAGLCHQAASCVSLATGQPLVLNPDREEAGHPNPVLVLDPRGLDAEFWAATLEVAARMLAKGAVAIVVGGGADTPANSGPAALEQFAARFPGRCHCVFINPGQRIAGAADFQVSGAHAAGPRP